MAAVTMASLPPRTYADQHRTIYMLTVPPVDLAAITLTEINAGQDVSCRVTQADTRFSATASETLNEPAVCEPASATTLGTSNFEATVSGFRFFDEETPGAADPEGDILFQTLKVKGTPVTFVERITNKEWDDAWAAGDEYSAFSVEADNWQRPGDLHTGYQKFTVPLPVKDAELNGVIAAATP
jgi:hypothetical protein